MLCALWHHVLQCMYSSCVTPLIKTEISLLHTTHCLQPTMSQEYMIICLQIGLFQFSSAQRNSMQITSTQFISLHLNAFQQNLTFVSISINSEVQLTVKQDTNYLQLEKYHLKQMENNRATGYNHFIPNRASQQGNNHRI